MLGGQARGQAQFDIEPTDSLVDVFATDSLTRIFQIDFPNTSGDSLALSWRYIDGGWTDGWDVNLCDLGECYTGVPADADMLAMGAEGAGFLKLIVNALESEGDVLSCTSGSGQRATKTPWSTSTLTCAMVEYPLFNLPSKRTASPGGRPILYPPP